MLSGKLTLQTGKEKDVFNVEKTLVLFSELTEIESNVEKEKKLMSTIERGIQFIESLSRELLFEIKPQGGKDIHDITSEMDKETVRDGLEFLEGSLKNLDSETFFDQIQAEIFKFHSIPRLEEEIEIFQIQIHEKIKAFINLNELMLVQHDFSLDPGKNVQMTQSTHNKPVE